MKFLGKCSNVPLGQLYCTLARCCDWVSSNVFDEWNTFSQMMFPYYLFWWFCTTDGGISILEETAPIRIEGFYHRMKMICSFFATRSLFHSDLMVQAFPLICHPFVHLCKLSLLLLFLSVGGARLAPEVQTWTCEFQCDGFEFTILSDTGAVVSQSCSQQHQISSRN